MQLAQLHVRVVSVSQRSAPLREWPLEEQRYSSPVATALDPRPVVLKRHDRAVDEPSVDGADDKSRSERHVRRARALTTPSRSTRRGRGQRSLAGQRCC